MISVSPAVFWLFVIMGLFYGACSLVILVHSKQLRNPSEDEIKHNNSYFNCFFLGFLIFAVTPILIALMLMAI